MVDELHPNGAMNLSYDRFKACKKESNIELLMISMLFFNTNHIWLIGLQMILETTNMRIKLCVTLELTCLELLLINVPYMRNIGLTIKKLSTSAS